MRIRLVGCACLLMCLSGCGRRDRQQILPQIAVLRFENLSSGTAPDWMGRAFAEVLSSDLRGSPQRYAIQFRTLHSFDNTLGPRPGAPGISAENTEALVAGANEAVYGTFEVANGVLRATAVEWDLVTHQTLLVVHAAGPLTAGVAPVADALARQLGEARPFATRNEAALREFSAALENRNPSPATQGFANAMADDPDFGDAYVQAVETSITERNMAGAEEILKQASAHAQRFSPLDQAEIALDAAVLHGDVQAQLSARRDLARLDPGDPLHHRGLAESLVSLRQFSDAIVEFRRALTIRPEDVVALNMMGYAAAYSGDLPTAIRVLRGYEQLRPAEPNPLDSLGDVHFMLGHFKEAEQFYAAAHARFPGFLNGGEFLKAAQARLMTGDVTGATALFDRYAAERDAAHDAGVPFHRAGWLWLTGARREAIAQMDRMARAGESSPLHELSARADAQTAIWELELGDRQEAADHARRALAESGPGTAGMTAVTASLALPESPALPAQSSLALYARIYGLLLRKQFQPAVPLLEEIYRRPSADLDDGLPVLLAWVYSAAGDWRRAEPLLRLTPLPQATGIPMFSSFYFPRLLALRAAVLNRDGHPPEASRYLELFQKLSGGAHTIWD